MKLILLLIFAPRFLRDMPPPGKGRFVASAQKRSRFYTHSPVEETVTGRRRAYVRARWLALKLDFERVTNEVEITWKVARVA